MAAARCSVRSIPQAWWLIEPVRKLLVQEPASAVQQHNSAANNLAWQYPDSHIPYSALAS